MPGPLYFAWSNQGDPWGAAMLREDEEIFAVTITQAEGDFATLQIDLRNPRVGLLAAGRRLWCWLSYGADPLGLAIPVFNGRLIGVPENLQDEVVRLQFVAKPIDYQEKKAAAALALQVAPFWDPVWLKDKVSDPDTVLEGYPSLWHIDRITLDVTASDINQGEDGTIDVTANDHFYDGMTVTYGQTPLRRVSMSGTVTWDQTGGGGIDLTDQLVAEFQAAGSPLPSPLVSSLTGDGLFGAWPAPGSSIGGGWSMGTDSFVQKADWIRPAFYRKVWVDVDVFPVPPALPVGPGLVNDNIPWAAPIVWEFPGALAGAFLGSSQVFGPLKVFAAAFPITPLSVRFTVNFTGTRKRSETVKFTLDADVQSIITDPGQDEEATVTLSSDQVQSPIDPGGAAPLFDSRSNTYFKTDRGRRSFEYLLMLARAKLLARARCVIIKFVTSWDFAVGWISCRHSARLFDDRLPGGVAEGKITGYTLSYSSDGIAAEITIGCTIGHGGQVEAVVGAPGFADPGLFADGVQALQGGQVAAVPGQIIYLDFANFAIADDDGVDLFNMVPGNVLKPTPAITLFTTGNVFAGDPKLTALASTDGLLAGSTYDISGPAIPAAAQFVFDGSGSGTLSIAPELTIQGTSVTIVGSAHNGFTVTNGPAVQAALIDAAVHVGSMPDPVAALKAAPTRVCVDLISVDGGAFNVDYPMVVEVMAVPKTIDLEAQ